MASPRLKEFSEIAAELGISVEEAVNDYVSGIIKIQEYLIANPETGQAIASLLREREAATDEVEKAVRKLEPKLDAFYTEDCE
jgi:hypothetical protein